MSDPVKQAWSDVGEGFSALGRMMKDRYQSADEAAEAAAAGDTASTEPAESTSGIREVFDKLVAAARELGEKASDVVGDDDVKTQARHAADRLDNALSATVDLIGNQVERVFKRDKHKDEVSPSDEDDRSPAPTRPEVPKSAPPADDARQ